MNPSGALQFIVMTLFDIYIMIIIARFVLQMVRADFYNPISQGIVKATNPLLIPLRRIVPGLGGVDMASVVLLIIVVLIKLALWLLLNDASLGNMLNPAFVVIFLRSFASSITNFFFFAILIMSIMSWFMQGGHNPVYSLLCQVCEPVLAPVRKIMPDMGGFDLSPMIAALFILLIRVFFMLDTAP